MTAPAAALGDRRLPAGSALVASVGLAAVALLVVTQNPIVALVPMAGAVGVWAFLRAPLRYSVLALIALVIFADIVPRDPNPSGDGVAVWHSIATPLQGLLLDNLNKLTGVEALRISGVEAALIALLALAGIRWLSGQTVDRVDRVAPARPMLATLGIAFAVVIMMEVWGAARGGDVRQSLWQFRQILWMPPLAALLCIALRGPRDFRLVLGVLTATCAAKIAVGLYYYVIAKRLLHEKPAAVTSHADTVLFVVVLSAWAAAAIDKPTRGRLLAAATVWGWTLIGMVINNRRTAFVSLLACLFTLYWRLPLALRQRIMRAFIYALPLVIVYFAIAAFKTTGLFAPGASILSVTKQKDGSSITRDIENFNLLVTLRQHPFVGSGWGHEYVELVKADDISKFFPQYRYIAHNSVLWLWSIGGLAGFTLLWTPVVTGIFLAVRSHARAATSTERVGACAALAVFVAFVLQAWADMGPMSWTTTSLLACALAITAKLATTTGAWPSRSTV